MYTLKRSFSFDSAHFLPNVPQGHKCGRLHGHTYTCTIHVQGELGEESGWLIDFGDLKKILGPIKEELDHRLLNDISGLENPTSEILCYWIWNKLKPILPILEAVEIAETCTTSCTYKGT